jgi:hypothetical protein
MVGTTIVRFSDCCGYTTLSRHANNNEMRHCSIDKDMVQLGRIECSYSQSSVSRGDSLFKPTFSWLIDHKFALNGLQLVDKVMHACDPKYELTARVPTITTYCSPRTSNRLPVVPLSPTTKVCFEPGALACRVRYRGEDLLTPSPIARNLD